MKRTALIAVIALAVIGTGFGIAGAHGGSSWGRSGHMGFSDRMGGYGGHMGSGDRMGGYDGHMMDFKGPGYGQADAPCWETSEKRADLTEKDAQELISNRVTRSNPNLTVGKVKVTEDGFEVQVVTKKGNALVDRLLVEKETGRVYRIYE